MYHTISPVDEHVARVLASLEHDFERLLAQVRDLETRIAPVNEKPAVQAFVHLIRAESRIRRAFDCLADSISDSARIVEQLEPPPF